MKKNKIFKTVNGIGLAANVVAQTMPYASPQRIACKSVSFGCTALSFAMSAFHFHSQLDKAESFWSGVKYFGKNIMPLWVNFISTATDATSANIPTSRVFPARSYNVMDAIVAGNQVMNLVRGIGPDAKKSSTSAPELKV